MEFHINSFYNELFLFNSRFPIRRKSVSAFCTLYFLANPQYIFEEGSQA